VIAIGQLRQAGLSYDAVTGRVKAGRLHRVHRGIYAVGHRGLSSEGRWMAAVLACGSSAALSHRSAAELWGLLKQRSGTSPVDVSVASQSGRAKRLGIRLYRRPGLCAGEITRERGIPVTTVAQTIADLKGEVPPAQWRRAVRQAEVLGFRTGVEETGERTRSELEHLFLQLCERHRLPRPEVNVRIGRHLVDFLWRERQLIVETDGYRYHRGRAAFENDRQRDLELRGLGYDVLRLTFPQVTETPSEVADLLRRELGRRHTPALPSPTYLPAPEGWTAAD
jgi:very-short-patch-repair endonuclease